MTNHQIATCTPARTRPSISVLAECFDLRDDGVLIWRARPEHHFLRAGNARRINHERTGTEAGCVGKDDYLLVRLSIHGAQWLLPAHQIVWAMTRGEWPSREIDHHNNVRADNRPLRLAYLAGLRDGEGREIDLMTLAKPRKNA